MPSIWEQYWQFFVWFIQSSYKRNCSVYKKVFSASNSNSPTPCLWPITYSPTLQQAFTVCLAYKMKSGSDSILSLERTTFHFRRLKMKSTFLLLATCSVFCKPSIEDNSIFNIHASLLSSENADADDEVGEENRQVLVFLELCVLDNKVLQSVTACCWLIDIYHKDAVIKTSESILSLKFGRTSKDEPWEEDPTLVDFKIISFDCPDCMERDWRSIINVHGKFLQIENLTL